MANEKTMREGLLEMVHAFEDGEIKHALFTTFNFDPGFFERNVLPLLCGLSLDDVQSMSIEAVQRQMYHPLKKLNVVVAFDQAVLQGFQGRFRYSLLPRHQKHGFFHAKIIVLAGLDAHRKPMATVLVSSGNLTLSGWGHNIEVAAWTPLNQGNAQELTGFYDYLNAPELDAGISILKQIRSQTAGPELFLHYPAVDRGTLFERLFKPRLQGDMHIFSPYWGEDAIRQFKSNRVVSCYPAKEQQGHQFPIQSERAAELGIAVKAIRSEEDFRHAKAYCWNGAMAIGSANCTWQALHSQNNVEAMLLFRDQTKPEILIHSMPLTEWLVEPGVAEGPEPIPVGVLVIADYAKRCYQVTVEVSVASRCTTWALQIGGNKLTGSANIHQEIPFGSAKTIAQVYRIDWQGSAESDSLMGMIIPKNGSDVELGYRPKRNMEQILLDMLRHKVAVGGSGSGGSSPDSDDDPDVEGDEPELVPGEEGYDFDMYGMYQSFYHLRKDIDQANLAWKRDEISDTLQEIMQAIQNGEIPHPVQQWLILQEAMELTRHLPDTMRKRFDSYYSLQTELNQQLLNALKSGSMMSYEIEPSALLDWTRKELGYAG